MTPDKGTQPLRHGEHILSMRRRGEHCFLYPLAVLEHALLVATGADIPGLAREGEQVIVTALVAADPGESLARIAAIGKRSSTSCSTCRRIFPDASSSP